MCRTAVTARCLARDGFTRRTSLIWTLAWVLMGGSPLVAQSSQSLLDRVARLEVEDVTLEVALRTLQRTSRVAIAFSPDRLPPERRVTCRCVDLTVGQALDVLLEGTGLQYREGRRQILIGRPADSPQEDPAAGPGREARGVLEGWVLTVPDSLPVAHAMVTVSPASDPGGDASAGSPVPRRVRTDENGHFTLVLPPGQYRVTAETLGAEDSGPMDVLVRVGQATRVTIHLLISPIPLEEIVVAPSTFGLFRSDGPSNQTLTREELESQPRPGNDIFRAVERLPGISTTDYSAKPFVRGARAEEVLTVLDGLELYEPYHIKYWDGSISIVDVETVGEVSLATGGFGTEYGDKSAGVLEMRTADPPVGPPRTTVGLDFISSMLKSEGTFHEGRGTWLTSARRGFLAFVFDLMNLYQDEDHRPSYYDIFSRVQYEVRPGHRLSAHILHAGDDNRGMEMDGTVYRVRYGNSYGWLNWEADVGSALSARTVASVGRVAQDREGKDYADLPELRVDDESTTWILGLRQDWRYLISPRMMLKWGFDLRRRTADYDYHRTSFGYVPNFTDPTGPDMWPRHDTVAVDLSRSGYEAGAYVADRIQLTDALTVEAGLRYDHQSLTGEQQVSPRLSAAFNLTPRTTLRGAWGHYHQSHALHELWVADTDSTVYPAQKAEHRIVGLEHRFAEGYALRLEAYQRRLSNPLPEYRRIARNMGTLWEEQPDDRIFVQPERGRAEGLELFLKSPPDRSLIWSGSYALSRVEEDVEGRWVPRPFDQRHAVNLQVAFRPTPDWTVAAGWIYHSPWPYTEVEYTYTQTVHGEPVAIHYPGVLNQERMIPYKRIDFRASRRFRLGRSDVLLYLDVFNVLNWENALDYEQYPRWTGSGWKPREDLFPQLWMMPSLGARWTF